MHSRRLWLTKRHVSAAWSVGFVSPDEAEQKTAESTSKQAELLSAQAKLLTASLEVSDCIMRAPFDGEIAKRLMDPGTFARPGGIVVTVVDRNTVRVIADVPEGDFAAVAPGTPAKYPCSCYRSRPDRQHFATIPAADPSTRTIHLEIDLCRSGTQAPGALDGRADHRGRRAHCCDPNSADCCQRSQRQSLVFVVEEGVAHKTRVGVLGEIAGILFVEPTLKPGVEVVTEGRALLTMATRSPPNSKARGNNDQAFVFEPDPPFSWCASALLSFPSS